MMGVETRRVRGSLREVQGVRWGPVIHAVVPAEAVNGYDGPVCGVQLPAGQYLFTRDDLIDCPWCVAWLSQAGGALRWGAG
jgi:hypothetical protein